MDWIFFPDKRYMFEAMRGLDVGKDEIQTMFSEVQQGVRM